MPPDQSATRVDIPDRIRPSVIVILVATVLMATLATFFGAARLFESQAVSVARSQHALYLRSLNEAIKQHQHLPFVLARNADFAERVARGRADGLNEMLQEFAEESGLEAIYVMALDGWVVAASNFASPDGFLGENYGFRPYFQTAITGRRSDYFAIGATTGRPGYFVAEPLRAVSGDLIGVVAIKLDVSELQSAWERRGENVLASNADGVIVLSSNPDWLYRTITDLDAPRRSEITQSRQFADEPLDRLMWEQVEDGRLTLDGQQYYLTSGSTDLVDWTVHYLTPEAMVRRQTLEATALLGAGIAVLMGFAAFLRSRRIADALAVSQQRRKELIAANQELLSAQEELERTSKLAALGQLAASVTHELGQPISALKNHLVAAEIGNEITSAETLRNFHRLTARMEAITRQLRFFAQGNKVERQPTDIAAVMRGALSLMQHDFDQAEVDLDWTPPRTPHMVVGNLLQLEQALVNLLRNALHACEICEPPEIGIEIEGMDESVAIRVVDNGSGLKGQTMQDLQEPFFSTKPSGDGMGLGLAITSEIIRAHGGTLSASEARTGGAVFAIILPSLSGGTV